MNSSSSTRGNPTSSALIPIAISIPPPNTNADNPFVIENGMSSPTSPTPSSSTYSIRSHDVDSDSGFEIVGESFTPMELDGDSDDDNVEVLPVRWSNDSNRVSLNHSRAFPRPHMPAGGARQKIQTSKGSTSSSSGKRRRTGDEDEQEPRAADKKRSKGKGKEVPRPYVETDDDDSEDFSDNGTGWHAMASKRTARDKTTTTSGARVSSDVMNSDTLAVKTAIPEALASNDYHMQLKLLEAQNASRQAAAEECRAGCHACGKTGHTSKDCGLQALRSPMELSKDFTEDSPLMSGAQSSARPSKPAPQKPGKAYTGVKKTYTEVMNMTPNQRQDYQMQLMLLEQHNKLLLQHKAKLSEQISEADPTTSQDAETTKSSVQMQSAIITSTAVCVPYKSLTTFIGGKQGAFVPFPNTTGCTFHILGTPGNDKQKRIVRLVGSQDSILAAKSAILDVARKGEPTHPISLIDDSEVIGSDSMSASQETLMNRRDDLQQDMQASMGRLAELVSDNRSAPLQSTTKQLTNMAPDELSDHTHSGESTGESTPVSELDKSSPEGLLQRVNGLLDTGMQLEKVTQILLKDASDTDRTATLEAVRERNLEETGHPDINPVTLKTVGFGDIFDSRVNEQSGNPNVVGSTFQDVENHREFSHMLDAGLDNYPLDPAAKFTLPTSTTQETPAQNVPGAPKSVMINRALGPHEVPWTSGAVPSGNQGSHLDHYRKALHQRNVQLANRNNSIAQYTTQRCPGVMPGMTALNTTDQGLIDQGNHLLSSMAAKRQDLFWKFRGGACPRSLPGVDESMAMAGNSPGGTHSLGTSQQTLHLPSLSTAQLNGCQVPSQAAEGPSCNESAYRRHAQSNINVASSSTITCVANDPNCRNCSNVENTITPYMPNGFSQQCRGKVTQSTPADTITVSGVSRPGTQNSPCDYIRLPPLRSQPPQLPCNGQDHVVQVRGFPPGMDRSKFEMLIKDEVDWPLESKISSAKDVIEFAVPSKEHAIRVINRYNRAMITIDGVEGQLEFRLGYLARENGQVSSTRTPPVPPPPQKPISEYRVLYHFERQSANEITIKQGDTVEVIKSSGNGWSLARKAGPLKATGWVPTTYLQSTTQTSEESKPVPLRKGPASPHPLVALWRPEKQTLPPLSVQKPSSCAVPFPLHSFGSVHNRSCSLSVPPLPRMCTCRIPNVPGLPPIQNQAQSQPHSLPAQAPSTGSPNAQVVRPQVVPMLRPKSPFSPTEKSALNHPGLIVRTFTSKDGGTTTTMQTDPYIDIANTVETVTVTVKKGDEVRTVTTTRLVPHKEMEKTEKTEQDKQGNHDECSTTDG